MKWLHVIPTINSDYGGPVNSVMSMARKFSENGHAVEIATIDSPGSPWLVGSPVPVHALGPGLLGYKYSPRLYSWLRAHGREYDFVVVEGLWSYLSYATWSALKPMGIPYFVFTHGMLDPWFRKHYPLKHVKKTIYWKLFEHKVLRDARRVIFTADEERSLASQSFRPYSCRGVVTNFGSTGPVGDEDNQRQHVLQLFPHLKNRRILLFLGRIHPKKGCDLLIQAFASECMNYPDWHLVIAGPDDLGWQSKLEEKSAELGVSNRITWTGMLKGDSKWGVFRIADGFILPSHQENFGIAIAEALACGIPVLITNKINIWREIESAQAGFVAPDTLCGVRSLLRKFFDCSADEIAELKSNATECFKERFDLNRGIESLLQIFQAAHESHLEVSCTTPAR